MKIFATFTLQDNIYWLKETKLPEAQILSNFLRADFDTDDISFYSWIEWLYDNKYNFTCSNATCTGKEGSDIEIYDIFDEEYKEPYFKMNKDKFAKFLHDWRDLTNLEPKTIIVTQHDDGSLTLEGKDFPEWAFK